MEEEEEGEKEGEERKEEAKAALENLGFLPALRLCDLTIKHQNHTPAPLSLTSERACAVATGAPACFVAMRPAEPLVPVGKGHNGLRTVAPTENVL